MRPSGRRGFDGEKWKKAERGGIGSKANFKGKLIKEGFGCVFDNYVLRVSFKCNLQMFSFCSMFSILLSMCRCVLGPKFTDTIQRQEEGFPVGNETQED